MSEDGRVDATAETELFTRARRLLPVASVPGSAAEGVFLVGGTVRDLILGRAFVDVDLAVDGDPLVLARALGDPERNEPRFGTLRVTRDGVRYDLARTRTERYAHPGALPAVAPAPIHADLNRRDFTVNAIAIGLTGPLAGQLISVDGALEDVAARRLAVLHDASFEDDPTRLLRLARYSARLGFEIAPHTRELAQRALAGGALETVSGTRIGNELRLLATEPDPVAAFEAASDLGLPWSLDPDLAGHALDALPADGRRDILVLACVFSTEPKKQLGPALDRLAFTAADRQAILEGTRAPGLALRLANASSRSEIARVLRHVGVETIALVAAKGDPSQPRLWLDELRHISLQISGDDLRAAGIAEGPAIGKALEAARDAMYDGEARDRASQLAVALKAAE
ncbi:MAG: hypothetical protein FWD04_02045 [Conexibacteraceae bacterium]|nr:hypothetical protein [Conexibacteraceae bacterium]